MIGLKQRRSVHFVGIGGVGMSGLAEFLAGAGYTVSGSDRATSAITTRLETLGIKVQYNHEPVLVRDSDLVVFSSAIKPENPELVFARQQAIPILRRAEMLGELMRMKFSVAIAGTHGKTTTTSLIGQILHDAQMKPTVIVGGILRHYDTNAITGSGDVLVAEADEYDRSFLKMYPSIAVVTNIEADHLDCYKDIDDITAAFVQFANIVPFYGALVACVDSPRVRSILTAYDKPVITYGLVPDADYSATDIVAKPGTTTFTLQHRHKSIGTITLPIPGLHNVSNSLAACAVALELGVGFETIAKSLAAFAGVKRRFEIIGIKNGVTVVDDYAHHPSEIRATIAAARSAGYARVIAVFQPHLFTRTRDFMDDFVSALCTADEVYVCSIYKSREEPIAGVSAETIVDRASRSIGPRAHFVAKKESVPSTLTSVVKPGDVVLVMGAGDINAICKTILGDSGNA